MNDHTSQQHNKKIIIVVVVVVVVVSNKGNLNLLLLLLERYDRRKQVYVGMKMRKNPIPCSKPALEWKILETNMHVRSN